jgi:hypothetical protein
MIRGPIFHMSHPAHYANLMIKYMVSIKLKSLNNNLRISNFVLPDWGINFPKIQEEIGKKTMDICSEQYVDFQFISYLAENSLVDRINWSGYGQRLEYFPNKGICRDIFSRPDVLGRETRDDCILCPVRAGEILDAIHPGYTVIPVDFYEDIAEKTGLKPTFIGQLDDNAYVKALRARFPESEFIPHMGALADFQTIRRAKNILIPVSTFAWLAAWLSRAERIIYPVFGLLNPKIFSSHNLAPVTESRYSFYEFPRQDAVPFDRLFEAHAELRNTWKKINASELVRL